MNGGITQEQFRDLQVRVISERTSHHGFPYERVETWPDDILYHAWSLIMSDESFDWDFPPPTFFRWFNNLSDLEIEDGNK